MTVLIGLALQILVLAVGFVYIYAKLERKARPQTLLSEVKREVNSIIVELNQTTDRNIGLIEERIESLNALLEKVDKRLTLLRREWERVDTSQKVYSELKQYAGGGSITPFAPSASGSESRQEGGGGSEGTERLPRTARRGLNRGAGGKDATSRSGGSEGDNVQRRRERLHEQVVSLHRKGIAANIIANRVGSTLGEVELIIALYERKA